MRKGTCVPMMALCLLLAGCGAGEENAAEAALRPYRDMAGCEMTAEIRCGGEDGTVEDFTLRCRYDPEGTTTVEEIHFVERGYEDLIGKLTALGADIKRLED